MAVDTQSLTGILEEAAQRLGVAGAQLAFWDGSSVASACTGAANAETGEPVTNDTLFQIGSTTKLYAAALNLQLVDEGKLDLDEPVLSYLPDFELADEEATRTVTLRHLHSMTSGIDNGPYADHGRGDDAIDRYVRALAPIPQIFPPGTGYGYSNASTTVAGRVTEAITGQAWEEALRDRFLAPAGLTSTLSLFEDLVYRRVAVGHRWEENGWAVTRPWRIPRSIAPAGSTLCATATDLVGFGRLMLAGGKTGDGTQLLSSAAVQTMHRPVVETPTKLLAQQWCVGSYLKNWGGATLFGHSGTNASGSSMLLWCPERNFAIASIANVPPLGYPLAYATFEEVLRGAFGLEPPKTPEVQTGVPVDAGRYTGEYVAYGVTHEIVATGDGIALIIHNDRNPDVAEDNLRTELLPLGAGRFKPADVTASGGRGWDVAFVGDDGNGHADYFINGVFAAKKK